MTLHTLCSPQPIDHESTFHGVLIAMMDGSRDAEVVLPENKACKCILVVEDDADIRETIRLALELSGYTVFGAPNGKEGIELLSSIPRPCVILLDLMMPVMNGWEFVAVLEKNKELSKIPVVIVTAYAGQAGTIHTQGVINKPFDLDSLTQTVRKWCGNAVSDQVQGGV